MPHLKWASWIYEPDSITYRRAKTVQLHLQKSSTTGTGETDVESELGKSFNKADLREVPLVGLEHIVDIADNLRE